MHIDNVSLEMKTPAPVRRPQTSAEQSQQSNGQESVKVNDRAQTSGLSRITARETALVRHDRTPRDDRIARFKHLATEPLPRQPDSVLDTILARMTGWDEMAGAG